ncbi:MAG: DUF427 domain-containing protein [Nocardioidaceae bacterium]
MALQMRAHLSAVNDQLRYEPMARRLRCTRGEVLVCDTTSAYLVWEPRRIVPSYAVPVADLRVRLSEDAAPPAPPEPAARVLPPGRFEPHLEAGTALTVHVDDTALNGAAYRPDDPDLADHVVLDFTAFSWTEEAQPMTGHPHDPFKRIDVLPSDRHVVVRFGGVVLADSTRPAALYETGLPTRWYLPRADVRMDRLEPSQARTVCAYKGQASYYSVAGAGDEGAAIAWTYTEPLHDATPVRDLLCFWNERTDLELDGAAVPRPSSPFSGRPRQGR